MEQVQTLNPQELEQKATLPDTITINGTPQRVDSIPELVNYQNQLRGQIAKQEKDKLYSQISDLKQRVSEMADYKPAPQQPINIDEVVSKVQDGIYQKLESLINTKLAPVEEQSELMKKQALEQYRMKLVSENQGKCMPELVRGDSKEALDSALEQSIKLFAQYGKLPLEETNTPVTQANTTASPSAVPATSTQPVTVPPTVEAPATPRAQVPIPAVPANPAVTVLNSITEPLDVSKMSAEEYAKNRDTILRNLKLMETSGAQG